MASKSALETSPIPFLAEWGLNSLQIVIAIRMQATKLLSFKRRGKIRDGIELGVSVMAILSNVEIYAEENDAARTFRPAAQAPMMPIMIDEGSKRRGRYSTFYRATFLDKPCAIKVIKRNYFDSKEAMQAYFAQERDALVGQHANPLFPDLIATGVLYLEDSQGYPCIVMELEEGLTIAEARDKVRKLGILGAMRTVCLPLADGLKRLEEQGFAHCDISPSNVILGNDDKLKLVDCGCLTPLRLPPRGEGTNPYVLPSWAGNPQKKPNCAGIDAYALALLSLDLLSLEDDLEPTKQLVHELAREMEPQLSCYGAASVEELAQAMSSFAIEMNRVFIEGLKRQIKQFDENELGNNPVSFIHARFASFCDSWCDSLKMAVYAWRLLLCTPMKVFSSGHNKMIGTCFATISYAMNSELMPRVLNWLFSNTWSGDTIRPTEAEVYFEQGFRLLAANETEGAEERFAKAFECLDKIADESDPEELPDLARFTERHNQEYAEWYYQEATKLNNDVDRAAALSRLACFVVDWDPERAELICMEAAELGDAVAMNNLASLVADRDPERAEKLYELATETAGGEIRSAAAYNLASLVADRDPERAEKLYELATETAGGEIRSAAAYKLASLVADRDPERAEKLYELATETADGEINTIQARLMCFVANNSSDLINELDELIIEMGKYEAEAPQ